jgi:hypothetical protein
MFERERRGNYLGATSKTQAASSLNSRYFLLAYKAL